jgi:hypothetical protein
MKHIVHAVAIFAVPLLSFVLVACPGSGPATITLSGDVTCTPPVTVTGSVTNVGNTTLHISATVKCSGTGVAGVMLDGTLPLATGDRHHSWGPTDGNGTATTTLDVSAVPVLPANFHVIVKDKDGNVVKDEPIAIQ